MVSVAARRKENNNQLGILLSGGQAAGLGILAHIYSHSHALTNNNNTNIVLKFGLRSLTTTPLAIVTNYSSILTSSSTSSSPSVISSSNHSNYGADYHYNRRFRSCHLCCKPLRPNQDIYMYRGDQGFCSQECRNRQIMMDERKEKEAELARKKKMTAASLISIDCRGCETCRLLEDLRRRRRCHPNNYKSFSPAKDQPLFSLS